jgi:hypothetical protein
MTLYSDGGSKENQTIRTEENLNFLADAPEKLSILSASS